MVEEIRKKGGELIVVGSGTPEQAKRFAQEEQLDTLVTDPTLEAYKIAGMKRGVLRVANLRSAKNMFRALGDGHFQGRTQGDAWQQGGVVVIADGRLLLQHAASAAGDPTDFRGVITALELAHPN
jgi:hypothetical protein